MKGLDAANTGWIYLHGFASSPASSKARAFVTWGEKRGLEVHALDLRVPSFEHLRFSAMVEAVGRAIAETGASQVVLVGSSLGGLLAARVAEADARVAAVFLMAPAFRLVEGWKRRLGTHEWHKWRETNALEVTDYATNRVRALDFGFVEELERIDAKGDGTPDVRVPTRIIHGLRDDVVPIEGSRAWAKSRPHVKLVEVDDTHELGASIPRILEEADTFVRDYSTR